MRYDYHGGMTEKYGNMFNFDPALYNVTGTTTTGFTVNNAGFVVAGNNKINPTPGGQRFDSDRTPVGHFATRRLCLVSQVEQRKVGRPRRRGHLL